MESEQHTIKRPSRSRPPPARTPTSTTREDESPVSRQFWRAGEYDVKARPFGRAEGNMNHVRVHPKFLHSNATSHKWALGALAELLDNAMDEIQNGATYVKVDKIVNPRDNSPALLVQDNGGGMTPNAMCECMSLGYSRKHTQKTIGRYGNGFKTSTMRLGADVIVFSSCTQGSIVTQSVGLLSYTFLRKTGREDVVVPMIEYKVSSETLRKGWPPKKRTRKTPGDSEKNLESILEWSPYASERELFDQFEDLGLHGTKVIVYNLWYNDAGALELDFETDEHDIQLNGDEKQEEEKSAKQQLALEHISNRYRHSLRAYSSILYLKMPPRFQIILRGKPVEHCDVASDLQFPQRIMYKPKSGEIKHSKSLIIRVGFTKEARLINVHGFNVYHKNRLIMPFWKVLHENSSKGRGVVGVLEANFVEPAHDKQDFERTDLFLNLEARLKKLTGDYWNDHCHKIGYQPKSKAGKALNQAAKSKVCRALRQAATPRATVFPENLSGPPTTSAKGLDRVRLRALQGSQPNAAKPDGSHLETEVIDVPHNSSKRSRSPTGAFQVETEPIDVPHNSPKRSRSANGASQVKMEPIDVPHNSSKRSRPPNGASQAETEMIDVAHNSPKRPRSANGASQVKTEPIDVPHNSPKTSRSVNGAAQVKTEPIDVAINFLERSSSANKASEAECQRTASNNADAHANAAPARDGRVATESSLLGKQIDEQDALIISLMRENAQLRSKCTQYDASDVNKQDSKVSQLGKELVDANAKNVELLADVKSRDLENLQLEKELLVARMKYIDLLADFKSPDSGVLQLEQELVVAERKNMNLVADVKARDSKVLQLEEMLLDAQMKNMNLEEMLLDAQMKNVNLEEMLLDAQMKM